MNRRSFLGVALTGSLATTAGCFWRAPHVPAGIAVETEHWRADVIEGDNFSRRFGDSGTGPANTYELAKSTEDADRLFRSDVEGVPAFLDATDFDRSYILVVRHLLAERRWLGLSRIERGDEGLALTAILGGRGGRGSSRYTVHSLLIRVTDDRADVPESVDVAFQTDGT